MGNDVAIINKRMFFQGWRVERRESVAVEPRYFEHAREMKVSLK